MRARSLRRAALWGVVSRPARTVAMALSLAAAVACVVFTASVLGGFSRQIERMAFGDYPRTLVVRANPLVPSRAGPPSLDDKILLERELKGVDAAAAWIEGQASVRGEGETKNVPVFGASGDYRRELDAPLNEGRWLGDLETAGLGRVCLLGPDLADYLGRQDLIGREISLSGVRCRVVGILGYARSRPAGRFNGAAVAPFMAVRRYFVETNEETPAGSRDADWLSFFMEPRTDMDEARYRADRLLRKLAGVPLSRESPYQYADPDAAVRDQTAQRDALSRLLWTTTLAALGTSLLGYGGIAFAATEARRREVALRLAMGASTGDVLQQITLEHALIGMTGSFCGLAIGLCGAWAASSAWSWPVEPSVLSAVVAIALGCGLGTSVGLIAARRAAQTHPALAAKG